MAKISASTPLCLGSASPRRRELLAGLGLPLHVCAADVDESVEPGEPPLGYLSRVVSEKWSAVSRKLPGKQAFAALLVADTIVVIDREILGKPTDVHDAERLLRRLVGREHRVYTRFAVGGTAGGAGMSSRTVETRVVLRSASDEEVKRYAATGEGLDKAGAYAAQGIGSFLIERVEGSYTNVVGLPLCEVIVELRELDLLAAFP